MKWLWIGIILWTLPAMSLGQNFERAEDGQPFGSIIENLNLQEAVSSTLQMVPNPFHHKLTIKFDLPKKGPVWLTVLDWQGKQVAVLAEQSLDAGSYTFEWVPEGMPEGFYLVQLSGEQFFISRILDLQR